MAGARYSVFLNRPMKRRWGEINLSVNRQNDRKSKRCRSPKSKMCLKWIACRVPC